MAKMKIPMKKDIPLSDIKSGNMSTQLSSSRMSDDAGSIRNSTQDFPLADLKSAAKVLRESNR